MLKKCFWEGEEIACREIFTTIPTDSGLCCAFNYDLNLKNPCNNNNNEYSCLVEDLVGSYYQEEGRKKASVGKKKGLQLVIDHNSNLVSLGTLFDEGIRMYIGQTSEFPQLDVKSFDISLGKKNHYDLSQAHIYSTAELRKLQPDQRQCFFGNEKQLNYFSTYTQSSCFLECKLQHAKSVHNCVPWYLPRTADTALCDPWEGREVRETMDRVGREVRETMDKTLDDQCVHCLPDCEKTLYKVTTTTINFQ